MTSVTGRSGWRWAQTLGLVAVVPALVLAYLAAMNALDTATPRAPGALQAIWWVCAIGAAAAAVVAGVVGGLVRAVLLAALLWGVLAVGVYELLGPTCPLAAIGAIDGPIEPVKTGMPPIRLQESFDALCSVSGTVAGSVDARWVLKAGALAVALSALGGFVALASPRRRRVAAQA